MKERDAAGRGRGEGGRAAHPRLDVLGPVGVQQGGPRLFEVCAGWADVGDHHSPAVPSQGVLLGARCQLGVMGTGAPTCLVVPPLPDLYQALLDHLGFLLQSPRRAAELDQESVLREVTLRMRQDLGQASPPAFQSDVSTLDPEATLRGPLMYCFAYLPISALPSVEWR